MDHSGFVRDSIIRDMSEGVLVIGMDGIIAHVNAAACRILDRNEADLTGERFARCFFGDERNDAFNQLILDAVYDASVHHRGVVPFYTGTALLQLHVTTSYLNNEGEKIGVIAVINDISELAGLRDAVKAMEQIRALNGQLEIRNRLLSETFGRFLSDEIVHQLLEEPDGLALGGKKRQLTVMMSDLRGFTALSERMEPQKLIAMLNHYLGEMTEIIQRRSGTIIEFIGDGILAIFGAPLPSASHAGDAVAAAVEMQARMEEVNRWNRERGYPQLEMGIGIDTGEMIVGNIGSERRTKYGVVGSRVNLCGRIESYTVGGQVLISPDTAAMIGEPLEIAGQQQVMPKGVKEPLTLSHVTGIGGQYQVYCAAGKEDLRTLTTPAKVRLTLIQDKHTESRSYEGRILALSRTEALLKSEAPVELYGNMELEVGGGLFAKAVAREGGSWRLRFTAVPEDFDRWLSRQK